MSGNVREAGNPGIGSPALNTPEPHSASTVWAIKLRVFSTSAPEQIGSHGGFAFSGPPRATGKIVVVVVVIVPLKTTQIHSNMNYLIRPNPILPTLTFLDPPEPDFT